MRQTFNQRQAIFWFSMYYIGSVVLIVPTLLTSGSRQDGWISALLAVGAQLLFIPIYSALSKNLKEQTFGAYIQRLFGKWGGKLVLGGFLLLYPFLTIPMTLRNLSDFTSTTVMVETPMNAINFLMMIVAVISIYLGVQTIGRASEITFPIVLLMLIVIVVSLSPGVHISYLKPIGESGIGPIIGASIPLLAFPYFESIILFMACPQLSKKEQFGKSLLYSGLISGGILTLLTLFVIMTLGGGFVADLSFPTYFVTRTINIGDFYERIEAVVSMIWYVTIFFRLTLLLFVTTQGLAELFAIKDHRTLAIPLAFISIVLAEHIWPNAAFLIDFTRVWPFYTVWLGVLFPILLLVMGKIRSPSAS